MDKIEKLLNQGIEEKVYTCVSYLIGDSSKILAQGSLGKLGEELDCVQDDTIYDLASVTKPLVTMAFMKLWEEGKVCLDDTVGRYLKGFRGSDKEQVTMYELLTHTSLIPGQVQLYRTCRDKAEMLDGIKYLPGRDQSKEPVMYSSQGMILLGEIISSIEQKGLDEVMRERVFEPLQMDVTCFCPGSSLKNRIAATEFCPWRNHRVVGEVHDENAVCLGGVCGHAGLFSNVFDLSRVGKAMLTGCNGIGRRYLAPKTIALMTHNHTADLNLSRGLGWQCRDFLNSSAGDLFSEKSYGHTGFTGTSIWIDPAYGIYAILLTNRVYYSRNFEPIAHVRRVFHNQTLLKYT